MGDSNRSSNLTTMTLRYITLIALLGIITAFALSLTNFASGIARSGSFHPSVWFSLASVVCRDGSLILLLATLYSRSASQP